MRRTTDPCHSSHVGRDKSVTRAAELLRRDLSAIVVYYGSSERASDRDVRVYVPRPGVSERLLKRRSKAQDESVEYSVHRYGANEPDSGRGREDELTATTHEGLRVGSECQGPPTSVTTIQDGLQIRGSGMTIYLPSRRGIGSTPVFAYVMGEDEEADNYIQSARTEWP